MESDKAVNLTRQKRSTVGSDVADVLRDRIRTQFQPGDELESEGTLAAEFGVSQRGIRDALRILAHQGLIETQQGKRAVVSRLRPVAVSSYFRLVLEEDSKSISDLIELREALETKSASLAAIHITEGELNELRTMTEVILRTTDRSVRAELDRDFHFIIAKASRNRFLESLSESLATVFAEERRMGLEITDARGTGHESSAREHLAIIDALASRSAEDAEMRMREHLKNVAARVM